jgi:hypothetical protein
MGIDTLATTKQLDLLLNNEMYESVTILLYKHCTSASSRAPCSRRSALRHSLTLYRGKFEGCLSPQSPKFVARAHPPVNRRSHKNNTFVHHTSIAPILSLLAHVLDSSLHSLTQSAAPSPQPVSTPASPARLDAC